MKKSKLALASITVIAAITTALALKKNKVASELVFFYDTYLNSPEHFFCTVAMAGHLYKTPRLGSTYIYIDTNGDASCDTGSYFIGNVN